MDPNPRRSSRIAAFAALSLGCDVTFLAVTPIVANFHWFLDCHGFKHALANAIDWSLLGAWAVFRVLHILCVVLGRPVAYRRFVVAFSSAIMMGCFALGSFSVEVMSDGAYSVKSTFFDQLLEIWGFGNRSLGAQAQAWGSILPGCLVFFLWIIAMQLSSTAATEATGRRIRSILNMGSRRTHGGSTEVEM